MEKAILIVDINSPLVKKGKVVGVAVEMPLVTPKPDELVLDPDTKTVRPPTQEEWWTHFFKDG